MLLTVIGICFVIYLPNCLTVLPLSWYLLVLFFQPLTELVISAFLCTSVGHLPLKNNCRINVAVQWRWHVVVEMLSRSCIIDDLWCFAHLQHLVYRLNSVNVRGRIDRRQRRVCYLPWWFTTRRRHCKTSLPLHLSQKVSKAVLGSICSTFIFCFQSTWIMIAVRQVLWIAAA